MKRIIAHWTAGGYKASDLDRKHYHFICEDDGNIVKGIHPPEANENPKSGHYAAHTLNCNTGSIGISVACMRGAVENKSNGPSPMTEVQFNAMCRKIAQLCTKYNIPVSRRTVLSHAEVQLTLGVRQRGKWDIAILPFKPGLKGPLECGDYMRGRVEYYQRGDASPTPKPKPKPSTNPKPIGIMQWLRRFFGFGRRS